MSLQVRQSAQHGLWKGVLLGNVRLSASFFFSPCGLGFALVRAADSTSPEPHRHRHGRPGGMVLGCYGNKESITPNMDRIAKEGAPLRRMPSQSRRFARRAVASYHDRHLEHASSAITDWIAPRAARGVGLPAGTSSGRKCSRKTADHRAHRQMATSRENRITSPAKWASIISTASSAAGTPP